MNRLLLVIDMQEGFREPETISIIPKITRLLDTFPGEKAMALFIDEPESQFETSLHWTIFQNKSNQRVLKELSQYLLPTFVHKGYTVLTKAVQKYISEKEISEVFLAGIFTDVCITKTAMDLFDAYLSPSVIFDACATPHGREQHLSTLNSLRHILGVNHVITSNLASLLRHSLSIGRDNIPTGS